MIDLGVIREGLADMNASVAHTASGHDKPSVDEIFAPKHHAGALDPNSTVVLGARGAGKSFWAGVLGDEETRSVAAEAYPNLGLGLLRVHFGFTGVAGDGSASKAVIDNQIPVGQERTRGLALWRCVILRALMAEVNPDDGPQKISSLMERFSDPEEWETECVELNRKMEGRGHKVLVIFDALDALATDWRRLSELIDALLEAAWEIRGFRAVRAKLFLRPDQVRDIGLRFVELPKLIAGATNLSWHGEDLYGMLFARLGGHVNSNVKKVFLGLLEEEAIVRMPAAIGRKRAWPLTYDRHAQARVFSRLAGNFMGRSNKKGRTYDWPINHLADGHGEITPRSFLTLMITAARTSPQSRMQAITAEGIRIGLREASKVRVNQLDLEFPWIKRVLAPLARLQVPSTADAIEKRWTETETIDSVMLRANNGEFLPPFDPSSEGAEFKRLIGRLVQIGILTIRVDGRYDMPDLFRVAARLLKKGGVAPI